MKNILKSKDSLLEQFKSYETDKKQVCGGYINGGMQIGGMSYIDQYDPMFGQTCDTLVSSHDATGWIDHIYGKTSN